MPTGGLGDVLFMIGKILNHYRIETKLGEGGMGEVYRAFDEHLQRDVAIKVLPSGALPDEAARKRFRKEALALSRLNHPNITIVYDFDTQDGVDFLVMEYLAGTTLSEKLVPGPLPEKEVIALGTQITAGLEEAHGCGVVHRDLKPANIILTPKGQVKILDFGLARLLKPASQATLTESFTETQTVAGTLPYMAPEQLRGETLDARTDIHSVGAILYEMAGGRRPFDAGTVPILTDAILHQMPVALRAVNASLSQRLEEIVFKCLEKDPELRYQSAKDLSIDLRRLNAPVPLTAEPRRRVFPRRWGLVLGVSLAVILALALAGATFWRNWHDPTALRLSTGALASGNPEANEYFERAMLCLVSGYDLPRARRMLEQALALDPRFSAAKAEYGFTHLLMIDGGWSNDSSWLYRAEEDIRRVLRDAPDSSRAHAALAAVYLYQGRKELVPGEAEKALKINPQELDAYVWMVNYHTLNGDYPRAEKLARQALNRAPLFFPARMNLGETLRLQGNTAEAIRQQEKVLEQDPANIFAVRFLTRTYTDVGDLSKARQSLARGRAADRHNYHTRMAWAHLLALEGKREEAYKEMNGEVLKYAAIQVDETLVVAEFYALLGETSKAIEWLDRAVRNGDERDEWFRRDSMLAHISGHPQFKQILDSIAFRRQQRRAQ